ncbi:MAG: alpha/beta fold hydrolase [Methylobacteriaceae bacterium]|nr:alpha/beta fold hydrolase [Methylobacteriaceae bacterium]
MTKFFITVRSMSGNQFNGGLGAIRYLAVPDGAAPAPSHTVPRTDWVKQIMQTFPRAGDGNAVGNLLVLVHGYNDGIADVATQHGDIAAGLANRLACTLISFDWPSWKDTFAYLPQLDVAKRTAIDLVNAGVKPLLNAQTDDCRVGVHVLCHSMGAYVVREALDHADDGTRTGSDWALSQLVVIGGDVEAADFVDGNKNTESMLGHTYRLTNYFNRYDEVLQISNVKRLGVEPRVGRVGLPANAPKKTVNVDCSAHFATIRRAGDNPVAAASWSHGWYFSDRTFHADLAETLSGAVDRTVVTGRTLAADGRTLDLPV